MKTKQIRIDRGYIFRACCVKEAATVICTWQRLKAGRGVESFLEERGEAPDVSWLEAVGLEKLRQGVAGRLTRNGVANYAIG